jgi:hypothetical protein
MPQVKAVVMYGDEHLGIKNDKFYLWADFMKLGQQVDDKVIHTTMDKQKPG